MVKLLLQGKEFEITEDQCKAIPVIKNLVNISNDSTPIELDIDEEIFTNVLKFMNDSSFDCSFVELLKTFDFLNMDKEYTDLCSIINGNLDNKYGKLALDYTEKYNEFINRECLHCCSGENQDEQCTSNDVFIWHEKPLLLKGLDENIISDIIGTVQVHMIDPFIYKWNREVICKKGNNYNRIHIKDIENTKKFVKIDISRTVRIFLQLKYDNTLVLSYPERKFEKIMCSNVLDVLLHPNNGANSAVIVLNNNNIIHYDFRYSTGSSIIYDDILYDFEKNGPLAIKKGKYSKNVKLYSLPNVSYVLTDPDPILMYDSYGEVSEDEFNNNFYSDEE